ncbi:MAG: hypothetical protein ABI651_10030, partial [Verrucomicrobiota bacterium]
MRPRESHRSALKPCRLGFERLLLIVCSCATLSLVAKNNSVPAQGWPIQSIRLNESRQIEVQVPLLSGSYHVLYRGQSVLRMDQPVSVVIEGSHLIDPSLLPSAAFYRVKRVSLTLPEDLDGDGLDDIFESRRPRYLNPLDASDTLRPQAGTYFINGRDSFDQFSDRDDAPGALGVRQLKFVVVGVDTPFPLVYFMNSKNYPLHARFVFEVLHWNISLAEFDAQTYFTDTRRKNLAGSIVAYDGYQSGSATNGIYSIEFWPADPVKFDFVKKAFDAIAAQMTWATAGLAYHPTGLTQEELYAREASKFRAS